MVWANRFLVVLIVMVAANVGLQIAALRRQPALPTPRTAPVLDAAQPLRPGAQDAKPGMFLDIGTFPSQGTTSARIAVVEFGDYECPFCSRHASEVLQPLNEQFVVTGKIRYAFANFPLPGHANARFFATAALCAGDQGQYWPMHDELFRKLPKTTDDVFAIASGLPLNGDKFKNCLSSPEPVKQLERDFKQAEALRVTGTPTFAIGPIDSHGRVTVQKLIVGAEPLSRFASAINETLAKIGS